jgi:hypothetical protein
VSEHITGNLWPLRVLTWFGARTADSFERQGHDHPLVVIGQAIFALRNELLSFIALLKVPLLDVMKPTIDLLRDEPNSF